MIEIYKVTNDLVTALKTVMTNVFPMLAPQGTSLPFIIYQHTGFNPEGSKDGEYEATTTFNITIITGDYSSGLQYVDAVRRAINGITSDYYTYEHTVLGASEQAYDDGYSQVLIISLSATK